MGEVTVLILCAGEAERFGSPKQLLEIAGESLLERQIRQVRARSEADMHVVTHEPQIAQVAKGLDVDTFHPEARACLCQTLLSTRHLWSDKTIVLLGDVIFSWFAMDIIFDRTLEIGVFGNEAEIYAVSFEPTAHDKIVEILNKQIAHECNALAGKMRHFYERYCDLPQGGLEFDLNFPADPYSMRHVMIWVRDYTKDIDVPIEHENFKRYVIDRKLLNDTPERTL